MSNALSNAINKKISELGGGGGTVSSSSYDTLNNAKKQILSKVAQKNIALDTLPDDINSTLSSMSTYLSSWQNADSMKSVRSELDSLLDRLNYAELYYTKYGSDYNADDVNSLLTYIKSAKEQIGGTVSTGLNSAAELYGKYSTLEEYENAVQANETYLKKIEPLSSLSSSELYALKKNIESDYENYKSQPKTDFNLLDELKGIFSGEPQIIGGKRKNPQESVGNKYNSDYAKYGFTVDSYASDAEMLNNLALQRSLEESISKANISDELISSVNRDEVIAQIKKNASSLEGNAWKYDLLTNEELAAYKYYADKAAEGSSSAKDTAYFMSVQLTRALKDRNEAQLIEDVRNLSENIPVLPSQFSVPLSIISGAGGTIDNITSYILTGKLNQDSQWNKLGTLTDTMRQGQAAGFSSFTDNETLKSGIEKGYMLGMSIIDNLAVMALSAGIGYAASAPGAINNISLALMGSSASSSTVRYALESGATDDQALALGLVAGSLEIVTEKLPLENLMKLGKEGAKDAVIREIAKQVGTEATEESISEIGNIIANTIVLAEKSDFAKRVAELEAQGDKNAKLTAFGELALQVIESGAGGAISGGVLSGGFIGAHSIASALNNTSVLKSAGAYANALNNAQSLIDQGLKYDEGTEINKLAKSIKVSENGQTADLTKLGKLQYLLACENKKSLTRELKNKVSKTVKNKSALNGLIKTMTGDKPSKLESSALAKDSEAQKILKQSQMAHDITDEWSPIVRNTVYSIDDGTLTIERTSQNRYKLTLSQNEGKNVNTAEEQSISQVSNIIESIRGGKIPEFNPGIDPDTAADNVYKSAIESNVEVPEMVMHSAQALVRVSDGSLNIRFAPASDDKNGIWERNADGTRTVTIAANTGAMSGVLIHEIFHDIKDTTSGKQLVSEITEIAKEDGSATNGRGTYYDQIRRKYEKHGIKEDIEEEVAATYLQRILTAGDSESLINILKTLSAKDAKALISTLQELTDRVETAIKDGSASERDRFLLNRIAKLNRLYNEAVAQSANMATVMSNARVDKKQTNNNKKSAPNNKEAENSAKTSVTRINSEKMHVSEKFSLSETKIPTREELESKKTIKVIDISTPNTKGSFKERRQQILNNAKKIISRPYLNNDTNTLIFLTDKSYTHTFNNLGSLQLNAAEHIPEFIENAVLTHSEDIDHGDRHAKSIYTFFAAAQYGNHILPVKLKVKEYVYSGQNLPQNIKAYFENSPQGYAASYDTVVLEVEEIEESPFGSAREGNQKDTVQGPKELSDISIADLLDLVKGNAKKYIPQKDLSTENKKFSLKTTTPETVSKSDRDVELSKARAHLTRNRVYSKSEVLRSINDTVKEQLSELLGYEVSHVSFDLERLEGIASAIAVRFNEETDDNSKLEFCRRAAEILTDSLVSVQNQELVNDIGAKVIDDAMTAYREMRKYRKKLVVPPDTYNALVKSYGEQTADRIRGRWISASEYGTSLQEAAAHIGIESIGTTNADLLYEFDRASREYANTAYSATAKLTKNMLGASERAAMIDSLANELYETYKKGGSSGKLALRFSALKTYSELIKVKQILNHHRETGVLGSPEYNAVIKQAQKLSRDVSKNNIKAENAHKLLSLFTMFLNTHTPELITYARAAVNSTPNDESSETTLTNAAKKYNEAKNGEGVSESGLYNLISDKFAIKLVTLEELTASPNAALEAEHYNTLSELLQTMRRLDSFYARIYRDGNWIDAEPIATEAAKDILQRQKAIKPVKKKKPATDDDVIDLSTGEKEISKIKDGKTVFFNSLSPETVAAVVSGYNENGELYRIIRDIQNGATEAQYLDNEYKRSFEKFFEDKANKGYLKHYQNDIIQYTFKRLTPTGQIRSYRVKMTVGEAMYMYMLSKRSHAELSLAVGKFDFNARKGGITEKRASIPTVLFSGDYTSEDYEAQIKKMASFFKNQIAEMYNNVFSEKDRDFIKICENFFNNTSSEAKRNADLERYGYTNVGEGYYIPIVRSAYARDVNLLGLDYTLDAFSGVRNFSFNKRTVERARAPLAVCDAWELVQTHSKHLANYVALTGPLENLQRIYNTKISLGLEGDITSLRAVVENESWDGYSKYLRDYIKDVQGVTETSEQDKMIQKILRYVKSHYAVSVLALNITSIVKQSSSAIAMLNEVSLNSWWHGLANVQNKESVDKYSHGAYIRHNEVDQYRAASGADKISKLGEKAMIGLSAGDRFTVNRMWNMCQYEVLKTKGYSIGSEENLTEAGKMLDEKLLRVQDTSNAATKSAHARSKQELISITTMFRSADIKMFSNLYYSFAKLSAMIRMNKADSSMVSESEIKVQTKVATKTATVWLTCQLYLNLLDLIRSHLIRGNRKEKPIGEGDMNFGEEYLFNILTSVIGQLPIIGGALEEMIEGYEPSNLYYQTLVNASDITNRFMNLAGSAAQGDLTSAQVMKQLRNTAFVFGELTGLPVRNVYNILRSATGINSAWRYKFDEFFGLNYSYSADLKKAIEGDNEKLATTIIDIMTSGRTGSDLTQNAAEEITSLYSSEGASVLPSSIGDSTSVTINGESTKVELTASQKKKLKSEYGKSSSAVSKMINTAMYRNLTSDERAAAVKSMYSIYLSRAKRKILGGDMTKPDALSSLMDESKLLCALSHIKTLKKDGNSNAKNRVRAYLRTLGLTTEEQNIVMYSAGYRSEEIKSSLKRTVNRKAFNSEEKKQILSVLSL